MKRFLTKKNLLVASLILVGLVAAILGGSYAVGTFTSGEQYFSSGNLDVKFEEGKNFTLGNAAPISIQKGLKGEPYTFTITNTGTVNASYVVKLEEEDVNTKANNNYIMITFKKGEMDYIVPVSVGSLGDLIIDTGYLAPSEKITYEVKMWVSYDAPNELMGKTYNTMINVESSAVFSIQYGDTERPVIALNGDLVYNIARGGEFIDPLGTVSDNVTDLTFSNVNITYEYYDGINLNVVSGIDTSKKGIYYIHYAVSDKAGNSDLMCRVVNINDNHTSISLNGDFQVNTNSLYEFNDLGAVAYNSNNIDISGEIGKVFGLNSNFSSNSIHFIKYVIKNGDNYDSVIRKVVLRQGYLLKDTIYNDLSKYGKLVTNNVTGTNPNNYLKINDIMYRIVSVNDNYVTVISYDEVDTIVAIDEVFDNSDVFRYLNEEFKKNVSLDYLYSDTVTLLSRKMYEATYETVNEEIGYLNNGKKWLIIDNNLKLVNELGQVVNLVDETVGIRPVLSLKADLIVSGSGMKDNPYVID